MKHKEFDAVSVGKKRIQKKLKLVCGVGVNDADYAVHRYELVDGRKLTIRCPFYSVWVSMIERCYSKRFQSIFPTYIGCSVDAEWHSFMAFRDWMSKQDHDGLELDKDLLRHGNKTYGPATCVFISRQVNALITDQRSRRGEYPMGVYMNKASVKYYARCRNPFTDKAESLGTFNSAVDAHAAWQAFKHKSAVLMADMQSDGRVSEALRSRYAPGTKHL